MVWVSTCKTAGTKFYLGISYYLRRNWRVRVIYQVFYSIPKRRGIASLRRLYPWRSPPYSSPSPPPPSPVNRLIVVLFRLSLSSIISLSSPTPLSLYCRVYFLLPPPTSIAPHCRHRCYRPSPAACRCQKPFNLEGVDFNVDSRCKVILDLLKWASTRKNKIGLQNANPLYLKSRIPFWVPWDPSWHPPCSEV